GEQRGADAQPSTLSATFLRVFPSLFARLATRRERQRPQSSFGNFQFALDAQPVVTRVEPTDRVVDPNKSFRLHFEQREFNVSVVLHFLPTRVQYEPQVGGPAGGVSHRRLLRPAACGNRGR